MQITLDLNMKLYEKHDPQYNIYRLFPNLLLQTQTSHIDFAYAP